MAETLAEYLGAAFLVAGGLFCLSAAVGILRLPDVFMRMHAATKAGTLGIIFIVLALAITAPSLSVVIRATLVAVFVILTAPVGAHLIGRAAYRTGAPIWARTERDPAIAVFHRREAVPDPALALIDDDDPAAGPALSDASEKAPAPAGNG
ncbi:MAG: monovalent cation/H(+) antiporter subunit G [Pseudomonadota bacterium]